MAVIAVRKRSRIVRERRAFTLIEILISMAIFAIGAVAILALFLAQSYAAQRAIDQNRAMEIASMVRAQIETSLLLPPITQQASNETNSELYFPITFPLASLKPWQEMSEAERQAHFNGSKSFTGHFKLPGEPYRGRERSSPEAFTVLPMDLYEVEVNTISQFPEMRGKKYPVWHLLPDRIEEKGAETYGENVDADERDGYSFSFFIRRSVKRHDKNEEGKQIGVGRLLDGLYVVQLRVFKGYRTNSKLNIPVEEFTFSVVGPQ